MKKMIALSTATLLLAAFLLSMPSLMKGMVTPVTVVCPKSQEISRDIYVSGSIEEQGKSDVTLRIPVVPGEVSVSVGDTVEAGQLLATVDILSTRAALWNLLEAADLIPAEYVAAMGSVTQLEGLESVSGLTATAAALDALIPSVITAPASGTVTSLSLIPGAMALPASAVCTISQMDSLRVRLSVEESSADLVVPGDTVVFKAGATGSVKYTGQVESVFPTASKTLVGTSAQTVVGVYASVDGMAERLKPGYSVNGVIKKTTGQVALVIPYEAVLQDDSNQEYVYLYKDGRAVRRNITTGTELTTGVAVTKGLLPEDYVVSNASAISSENSLLTIVK